MCCRGSAPTCSPAHVRAVAAEPYNGRADMPPIAEDLHRIDRRPSFRSPRRCSSCASPRVADGDIGMTDAGRRLVSADSTDEQATVRQHVRAYVPLDGHINAGVRRAQLAPRAASRFATSSKDNMYEEAAEAKKKKNKQKQKKKKRPAAG